MKIAGALSVLLALAAPSDALLGRLFKRGDKATVTPNKVSGPGLPPITIDNKGLDFLFDNNKKWKKEKMAEDSKFFQKLGTTHTPEYMYIGCVDGRVPENLIMGQEAGQIFCHRNVANLVVSTDMNLMSALQYAVSYLKVKHILVCGHYECGGVKAADSANDHQAPLETWLRNFRDVYRLHASELDSIKDPNERHRKFVDLNIVEQACNVFKTGVVQQRRIETAAEGEVYPKIHAMVFDTTSGDLKRIPVNFEDYMKSWGGKYELFTG